MLKSDICLQYSAVTSFYDKVMNLATKNVPLIINCKTFTSLDYTSIKVYRLSYKIDFFSLNIFIRKLYFVQTINFTIGYWNIIEKIKLRKKPILAVES